MAANRRGAGDISAEQRRRMIAEAAYFRAEHNGFNSDSLGDWLNAEAEIDRLLRDGEATADDQAKHSFRERFERQLSEWDERLEELKHMGEEVGHKLGQDMQSQMAKAAEFRTAAQKQLLVLREHGAEAWDEVRRGAEQALDELHDAIGNLAAQVKTTRKHNGNSGSRRGHSKTR